MNNVTLKAEIRKITGHKVKELRAKKLVPCVVYGHGVNTQNLAVPVPELDMAVAKAGSSTIVELTVAGKKRDVVIHDLQHDPVSGEILHCDFYQVKKGEKIKAEVNLRYSGVSAAVKDFGGILVKSVDKLEIEALPKDLPHEVVVDISLMKKINDSITLEQLDVPSGVKVLSLEKNQVIASVTPPRTEEELKKLDEEVAEDVEGVEGVKKEEEGVDEQTSGEQAAASEKEGAREDKGEANAKNTDDAGQADKTAGAARSDAKK